MKVPKFLRGILCLAVLALTSCSGVQSNFDASTASTSDPVKQLMAFVVTDLKSADSVAKATGDTVGATCYEYLIPKVVALQDAQAGTDAVTGAASAAEVQRGVLAQITNLKTGLNVACAPLVLDSAATAAQLGLKIGGLVAAVSTGGVALPLAP